MLATHAPLLKRCWLAVCGLLWLIAPEASAQVRTEVRLEKPRYIAGEPVFVIVDVTNIGTVPIAYDGSGRANDPDTLTASVESIQPDRPLSDALRGCYGGSFGNAAWGVDHPPLLMPGAQRPFRYLFSGYTLAPGRYRLSVSGRVNLEWRDDYVASVAALVGKEFGPVPPPVHKRGDPVEGARVDRRVDLVIDAGSDEALRAAFAPYLADADGPDLGKRLDARRTILRLAPPVLEESIVRFTREHVGLGDDALVANALNKLATLRSPLVLKELVLTTTDETVRSRSLWALSVVSTPDDVPFLSNIFSAPDASLPLKQTAALGLGHAGSDAAIDVLNRALSTADAALAGSIIQGLGISKSRLAVPALVAAAERASNLELRLPETRGGMTISGGTRGPSDICDALATLTHLRWCDSERDRDWAALKARWERWWAASGATTRIYGNEACVVEEELPPLQ